MATGPHCDHDHSRDIREMSKRRLSLALVLILGFMFVEVVGGILAGSLTLLADAGHMLTDGASIGLALLAMHFATRAPSRKRTYGYHRLEILAALVNALTLWGISVWIMVEAFHRFSDVPEVGGGLVLGVGSVGLLVNIVVAVMLHSSAKHNINVEGAFQHVIADLLGSVAVVVSGVLIWAFEWYLADPILSVIIGILILVSAWRLLKKTVHVLLEGAPDHIDLSRLCDAFVEVQGVRGVHDVHVWTLASGYDALTAHVMVDPDDGLSRDEMLGRLRAIAYQQFQLQHITLQLETAADGCMEDHQTERPLHISSAAS